jgi:hypothetical protein
MNNNFKVAPSTDDQMTIYLGVSKDKPFMKELKALPQVVGIVNNRWTTKVVIELNPLFSESQLTDALAPLVDSLVVRQTGITPYIPNFALDYWDNSTSRYALYLQIPADEMLLDEIENDPGTKKCSNFPDERRIYLERFIGIDHDQYIKRIRYYAALFLARQI